MPRPPTPSLVIILLVLYLSVACRCHSQLPNDDAAPAISQIRGCSLTAGNSTAGCNYNNTLLIYGTNFPLSCVVTVWIGDYPANDVTVYNSSVIQAYLPYVPTDGSAYHVQIDNKTVTTLQPFSILLASQVPIVYRVSGCKNDNDIAHHLWLQGRRDGRDSRRKIFAASLQPGRRRRRQHIAAVHLLLHPAHPVQTTRRDFVLLQPVCASPSPCRLARLERPRVSPRHVRLAVWVY